MPDGDGGVNLQGQVAVVTGGARGLGREIARTLAARGAEVVSVDLDASDETVAALTDAGGRAASYCADLTDATQVHDVFAAIIRRYQTVDILVNNAGFYAVARRPFWEIDLAEWEQVMMTNVRSVFLCSRAAATPMREQRSGRIINISSAVITFGMPNLMHYVAAKSAVAGMTRSMAAELGSCGISVNAVAPGLVPTAAAVEAIGEDVLEQAVQSQAIRQPLSPGDIANTVTFLCGAEAAMLSGQTLLVNGGATFSGI